MSVEHYENFPVASWLCPPDLRPAVTAIYWFARVADDIADEGDASPAQRRADLADYRRQLHQVLAGEPTEPRWAGVFEPLAATIRRHALPGPLLADLLDAFERDTWPPDYPDRAALLDYCRLSAHPVGRLLLHLYGVDDEAARRRSDAICSALQLINFWQDLSRDLPAGRRYLPRQDLQRLGLDDAALLAACGGQAPDAARQLVHELCDWAVDLMHEGAPLARQLPGRIGWELGLVVEGGLRIAEKIRAMEYNTFSRRPALNGLDAPLLLWRAARARWTRRA